MTHRVTLISGDGIGPEITEAMRRCVEATGVSIEWEKMDAGAGVMEKEGTPLPQKVLDSIRKNRVAIKGPVTTPVGGGFRSVNVALRRELDLFACLRPCRSFEGLPTPFKDVDLVVVRENSEDLYAGIEFFAGTKEAHEVIREVRERGGVKNLPDSSALSIKLITQEASRRIARFAFDYAVKNGRRKVTAVHKANIMKATDGLFLEATRSVAAECPGIIFEDRIVDNCSMQLVLKPGDFDVLVLPNLYGDIVSDLCAGLVGGLGVAPGANIGKDAAVFEATHGSAPKYRGMNKVNPTALILSAVLMLRHLGEKAAADALENAVREVIREGRVVTYDLKPELHGEKPAGTREMADAIIAKIRLV